MNDLEPEDVRLRFDSDEQQVIIDINVRGQTYSHLVTPDFFAISRSLASLMSLARAMITCRQFRGELPKETQSESKPDAPDTQSWRDRPPLL